MNTINKLAFYLQRIFHEIRLSFHHQFHYPCTGRLLCRVVRACKAQAPVLLEVARELSGKLRVVKIDVDKNQQLASVYEVQGVPTLAVFKEGKMLYRQSGMHNKAQLMQVLKPFL